MPDGIRRGGWIESTELEAKGQVKELKVDSETTRTEVKVD